MSVKKMKVVTVETPGTLKESMLTLTGEYDISKASFIYEMGDAKIVLYGKTGNEGVAGQENKYEFPPPFDKELFFGKCFLVKYSVKDLKPLCLTVNEWNEIYNKMYGGFEELTDVDEEDAREIEEEKQLLNTPTIEFTKEGYVKDGMIVDDDEDENYEPIKQKKSTKKRKSKEDIPEPVKIKKSTKKPSVVTSVESLPIDVITPPLVPPPPSSSPSSLSTEPTSVNPVKPEKKKTTKAKKTPIESLPDEVVLNDNSTTVETPTITEKKKTSKSKKVKIEAPDANGTVEPDLLNDNNNNTEIKKPPRVRKPKVEVPPLPLSTMTETLNEPPTEVPPPKKSRAKKPAVKQPPTEEIVQSTDELPTPPPPTNTKKPKASKESKPKKTASKTKKTEDIIADSHLTCANELTEEDYLK